jgi:hypothetical protein
MCWGAVRQGQGELLRSGAAPEALILTGDWCGGVRTDTLRQRLRARRWSPWSVQRSSRRHPTAGKTGCIGVVCPLTRVGYRVTRFGYVADQGGPADQVGPLNALPGTPGAIARLIPARRMVHSRGEDSGGLQGVPHSVADQRPLPCPYRAWGINAREVWQQDMSHDARLRPAAFCVMYKRRSGGVNATLFGRTICLSVEASAGAINLMLPHIMAADR